jgi:hypothetical protein
MLSQRYSPGFENVIVQPVALARVLMDATRVNVLLTVVAPTGEQMTLELPPHELLAFSAR